MVAGKNTGLSRRENIYSNIPREKILLPSLPLCLQAEELIIPSYPGSVTWMPAWSCQWLREKILGCHGEKTSTPGRRLYIRYKQG